MSAVLEEQTEEIPIKVRIPDPCLIVLVGSAGAGKSTFCRRHFSPGEVVSSDRCREFLQGGSTQYDPSKNAEAFAMFHQLIAERLDRGKLAVADSTALLRIARSDLICLAERYGVPVVAVLFDTGVKTCISQDQMRDRHVGSRVIEAHARDLNIAKLALPHEEFDLQITVDEGTRNRIRLERDSWEWAPPPAHTGAQDLLQKIDRRTPAANAPPRQPLTSTKGFWLSFTDGTVPEAELMKDLRNNRFLTLYRAIPPGEDVAAFFKKEESEDLSLDDQIAQGTSGILRGAEQNNGPWLEEIARDLTQQSYWRRKGTDHVALQFRVADSCGNPGLYAITPLTPPPVDIRDHHDFFWEFAELPTMSFTIQVPDSMLFHPERNRPEEALRWIKEYQERGFDIVSVTKTTKAPTRCVQIDRVV